VISFGGKETEWRERNVGEKSRSLATLGMTGGRKAFEWSMRDLKAGEKMAG
jgi:hypothetical protein